MANKRQYNRIGPFIMIPIAAALLSTTAGAIELAAAGADSRIDLTWQSKYPS